MLRFITSSVSLSILYIAFCYSSDLNSFQIVNDSVKITIIPVIAYILLCIIIFSSVKFLCAFLVKYSYKVLLFLLPGFPLYGNIVHASTHIVTEIIHIPSIFKAECKGKNITVFIGQSILFSLFYNCSRL